MPLLVFCIGSNENAAVNIRRALTELKRSFGPLRCSNVYRSAAAGFDGADFLNLAALAETEQAVPGVVCWLKQLELRLGRDPAKPSFSSRPIDVDVFVPGAVDGAHGSLTVSHQEVLDSAFILCPLAELLPDRKLEPDGSSFAELWTHFDKSRQPLTPVELDLPGQGPRVATGIMTIPSGLR